MKFAMKLAIAALLTALAVCMVLPVYATEDPSVAEDVENVEETPLPPPVLGDVSPYGVYISGIAVTEENKEDIFGDISVPEEGEEEEDVIEYSPRATFIEGDKENELRLSGVIHIQGLTIMKNVGYAILSTNTEKPLRVHITEGSDVSFEHGVLIESGSFTVDSRSNIVFSADTEDDVISRGTSFIEVREGNIQFDTCRVEGNPAEIIDEVDVAVTDGKIPAGVAFSADRITLNDTTMKISSDPRVTPLHAILWANKTVDILDKSVLEVSCYGYFADALVRAGDKVQLSASNVLASGLGCIFDLPRADLVISGGSYIHSSSLWGMYLGGECRIDMDTGIDMSARDGGIAVVGDDASLRVNGGKFYIKQNNAAAPATPRANNWDGCVSAALYLEECPVTIKDVNYTSDGYTYGILCVSDGEKMSFTGSFHLSSRMAFFAAAENKEDISFGSGVKGNATLFSIPAETELNGLGKYAMSMVSIKGALASNGTIVHHVKDVAGAFQGYVGMCDITSETFPAAAIIAPCILCLVVTAVIIILYKTGHIFAGKRRALAENKDTVASDTESAADEAAPAGDVTENTEETTDAND